MLVFIPVFDTIKMKDFQIQQGGFWCGRRALKSTSSRTATLIYIAARFTVNMDATVLQNLEPEANQE
jgi:hypothetical protein